MKMNIRHFLLRDWEEPLTGIVLLENSDWVLLQEIPADFSVDGYQLVHKQELFDHYKDDETDLKELVLQLKGFKAQIPNAFKLGTVEEMLQYIDQHYKLFGIQDEEDHIFVGSIQSIVANEIRLNHIDAFGYPDPANTMPIFLSDIQSIQFDSDYLNAIKLLAAYRQK